jgi:hypothetical protein
MGGSQRLTGRYMDISDKIIYDHLLDRVALLVIIQKIAR